MNPLYLMFALVMTSAITMATSTHQAWPNVVIRDDVGDVKVSNFGGLPNVSIESFDLKEVSFKTSEGFIEVSFTFAGKPITVEEVGVGNRSKFMFSYTLMGAGVVNGTPADITVSYDNVVPSPAQTSTVTIITNGTAYIRNGNVSVDGNTLKIVFKAPPGFMGLGSGTITAISLMQSNTNAFTGIYDEASVRLGTNQVSTSPKPQHQYYLNISKFLPWILGGLAFVATITGLGYLALRE